MLLGQSPVSRLQLGFLVLVGYTLYNQYKLQTIVRPSFNGLEFFEDTAAGNGTRYRVLRRAAASQGALSTVELLIRPGAPGFFREHPGSPPFHSHDQDELIVVRKGTIVYALGEARHPGKASEGETVTIPRGEPHSYQNLSPTEPLLIEIISTPAGPLGEKYYESIAGLVRTYGDYGMVHPLQLTLLFQEAGLKVHGYNKLYALLIDKLLPPFARVVGFKPTYPAYSSGGPAAAAAAALVSEEGEEEAQEAGRAAERVGEGEEKEDEL